MVAKFLMMLEAILGSCATHVFLNFMAGLLGIVIPVSAQTSAPPPSAIKVKIEAAEDNKKLLLSKLNEQGTEHGLKFELGDEEFAYRIEFDISYLASPAGSASGTYASAKVYDGQGAPLFSLERNSRTPFVNQDARVADAVAKEIVKRLLKVPPGITGRPAEAARAAPQQTEDIASLNAECERGELPSCTSLGIDYLEGKGVAKDEAKARTLVERACDGGDARGCNNLGIIYAGGRNVTRDEPRAAELYRRACDKGYLRGCINLASMYDGGRGVAKDESHAVELVRQACDGGESLGCWYLAQSYEQGHGVAKDEATAANLYEQACNKRQPDACLDLGVLYERGQGVTKDDAHAAELYKQACNAGSGRGCGFLGDMYVKGLGVKKDKSRANGLYEQACQLGWAQACMKK